MHQRKFILLWVTLFIIILEKADCFKAYGYYTLGGLRDSIDLMGYQTKSGETHILTNKYLVEFNAAGTSVKLGMEKYLMSKSTSKFYQVGDEKRMVLFNPISGGKTTFILELNRIDGDSKAIQFGNKFNPTNKSGRPYSTIMPDGSMVVSYIDRNLRTLVLAYYNPFFRTGEVLKTFLNIPLLGGEDSVFQCDYALSLQIFLCLVSQKKVERKAYIYGVDKNYELINDPFFPIVIENEENVNVFTSQFYKAKTNVLLLTIRYENLFVKMFSIDLNVSNYNEIKLTHLEDFSQVRLESFYRINEKYSAYLGVNSTDRRPFGFFFFNNLYEKAV